MKKILILSIIVFISCGRNENTNKPLETESKQTETKKEINKTENAISFINAYVENCNNIKQALSAVEWANSSNLCTKHFKTEIKNLIDNADPEMGLGFDPIFNAQDYPEKGFELDSLNEKTNYITVKGKDNSAFKIVMILLEENGKWLVDGCGYINIPDDKRAK